jgi:serine/threonine protein kinase
MSFGHRQLERGDVIGGYRIDELISRGGMGIVYRATNVTLNRIYALKVLAPELSDDEQFRERFKREIRIAASVHHPHVVAIHYAGEHEGMLFLIMDFIYGTDLSELLRRHGALEPERAVELLSQMASALDAAHSRGLVHRDVKPANLLITVRDGEEHSYLTDFGLAKRSDTVGAMTKKGVVVGTVDYMAPEQITGGPTDARTDIYSLGCTFFHMMSGSVPFERENSIATLFAHVNDPPPPLDAPLADSYPALGAVIEKAMAKDPADRYVSAGDLAAAAQAALRGMEYTQPPTLVATGEAMPIALGRTQASPEPAAPEPAPVEPRAPQPATPEPRQPALPHEEPAVPGAPVAAGTGEPDDHPSWVRRYRWPALAAFILIAAIAGVIIALSSGGKSPSPPLLRFSSIASPIPTNHVSGAGAATVVLHGNVATITLDTNGLLNAVHLMHIHGGTGRCPTAAQAQQSGGHRYVSASLGDKIYGGVVTSLTQPDNSTSPAVHLISSLYQHSGNIRYTRTITLAPGVAAEIRQGLAVVVVHGIDYNGNGRYDNSLGTGAELDAPALCGALFASTSATAQTRPGGGTVFAASLKLYGGPAGPGAPTTPLLCHLAGAPTTAPPTLIQARGPTPA